MLCFINVLCERKSNTGNLFDLNRLVNGRTCVCVRESSRCCSMIRLIGWHASKKKEIRVNEHNNNNNYYMNDNIWQPKRDKNPSNTTTTTKNCWQKMERHKIDGCTSTVSSLFLPHLCRNNHFSTLECMQNLQFLPLPHTHLTTHSRAFTYSFEIAHSHPPAWISCHSFLVIILMFLLTAMVKHFEYSAAHTCVEKCSHGGVPAFSPLVVTFFPCVHSTLGTFFGRWIGNRSYVFASSSPSPHSLTQ